MADPHSQRCVYFLVSILFSTSVHLSKAIVEHQMTCGQQIDLARQDGIEIYHSGILKGVLPTDFAVYNDVNQRGRHCDILINFNTDQELMLEMYYVDIVPISNEPGCSTGLEVFQGNSLGSSLYGSKVCGEAWEWEKIHRDSQQQKRIANSSPVTFRFTSTGQFKGEGFKVHFNTFMPRAICIQRFFRCEDVNRCVHDDLRCDGWDDCGDDSDEEEEAGCGLLTASEICATIIAILLFIMTIAIFLIFFVVYRRRFIEYAGNKPPVIWTITADQRSESKQPITSDTYSISESQITFPRRYNSQESMNKSAYSRSVALRRDSDNESIDKLELENADRHSYKSPDNGSERSYGSKKRSRYADSRGGSTGRDLSPPRSSSKAYGSRDRLSEKERHGSRDRLSEGRRSSRDRRRDYRDSDQDSRSDDEDRDRHNDRRRRHRREKSRDLSSDDSDYDDRRRRRSRSRRSYDRYSDEDTDSEMERERRRRRRSRERRNRDRHDPENSDRERTPDKDRESDRPRRRSSRERNRYDEDRDRGKYNRHNTDDTDNHPENKTEHVPEDKDKKDEWVPLKNQVDVAESQTAPSTEAAIVPQPTEPQPTRYENRRSRSRDNLRPRDEQPPTPPSSEKLRQQRLQADHSRTPEPTEGGPRDHRRRPGPTETAPRDYSRRPVEEPADNSRRSEAVPQNYPRRVENVPNNVNNSEPAQHYRRRSNDERRRRSRGPPPTEDYAPPEYEEVVVRPDLSGVGGYKEAAV